MEILTSFDLKPIFVLQWVSTTSSCTRYWCFLGLEESYNTQKKKWMDPYQLHYYGLEIKLVIETPEDSELSFNIMRQTSKNYLYEPYNASHWIHCRSIRFAKWQKITIIQKIVSYMLQMEKGPTLRLPQWKAANKINNGDRLLQQVLRCLEHEVCLPQSLAPVSENAKRTKLYNLIIPRTQN